MNTDDLTAYSCMVGHIVYSSMDDLSFMICPVCLGPVKNRELNDPRILALKQEENVRRESR